MSKVIPFFELFSDYVPVRDLRLLLLEVLVEEAIVHQDTFSMELKLLSREKLSEDALEQVRGELCQLYHLQDVQISVKVVQPPDSAGKKKHASAEGKKRGSAAFFVCVVSRIIFFCQAR